MNNITCFRTIIEEVRIISLEEKKKLIQKYLYIYVDDLILRTKYLHRNKGRMEKSKRIVCDKCGTNWTNEFVRNGSYTRGLMVKEGYIQQIKIPRIKCVRCGRKIKGINGIIKKHARLWYDTSLLIKEMSILKSSIRDIKDLIKRNSKEVLSTGTIVNNIRKINKKKIEIKDYPKEVGLDAFWGSGKSIGIKQENIVLLAVDQNKHSRNKILTSKLCDGENEKNWSDMIDHLDINLNINHSTGLINYISDGQKGILASIDGKTDYNTICSFHILGNIKQNMPNESNKLIFKLMKDAKEIFKQKTFQKAEYVYRNVERKWWRRASKALKNLRKSLYATKDFWNNKDKLSQTNNTTERLIKEYKRKIKQMEGLRSKATSESIIELLTLKINNKFSWYEKLEERIIG